MIKRKTGKFPVLLIVAGSLLLVIAAVLLITQNPAGGTNLEPSIAAGSHEEETYPEIQRVSLEDAKAAFDAGTAVFMDVRGTDAYAMSHIPTSLSIPLAELEPRLKDLDPNQWIITYCT